MHMQQIQIHLTSGLVNSLRPRQNGRHFPDDIFKWIFVNANVWILIKISLKFVSKGLINHIPALVQIMAWRRPGDKPLSEPMMVSLLTHICVTRPQWVKHRSISDHQIAQVESTSWKLIIYTPPKVTPIAFATGQNMARLKENTDASLYNIIFLFYRTWR